MTRMTFSIGGPIVVSWRGMYVLRRRAASAYSRQAPRPFVWSRYNRHVCPSSCF